MSAGGVGIFAMYMLNNTGDRASKLDISLSSSHVVDQKALDDGDERQLCDVIGKNLMVNSVEGSGQVNGNHDGAM